VVVDDDVVFRLPRTDSSADRVEVDVRLLRALSALLPIRIPRPASILADPAILGYERIPGRAIEEPDLIVNRSECDRLGTFLDRLHRFPIERAVEIGLRPCSPDSWRADWYRSWKRYRQVLSLLPQELGNEAERRWEVFLSDDENFGFDPGLIHADLSPQHVLWKDGCVSGVIDWSDAQIGDVAMDFAWPLSLPGSTARLILSAYSARGVRGLETRARFYKWTGWWSEAVHGLETNDMSFVDRGIAGILRQLG
jgi:aminoglycoside phosphotransferase (APT) family kinase protein